MENLSIRRVKTMKEIHGIVEIQRKAWDMTDLEIVPTFEMKAVSDIGVLLAAFDTNDTPIGFIYAFHHFPHSHYSHMMAVLPEYQGSGIGYLLKKKHRELALASEHRVDFIEWTVDPLLPNNAYLNFAKLGGYSNTYYPNYYGDPAEIGIYRGLPTDRLLIKWPIRSSRVAKRMENYKADRISQQDLFARSPALNTIENDQWVELEHPPLSELESFVVQVPANFQELRHQQLELAKEWRYKFRELAMDCFEKGWYLVDYHTYKVKDKRLNFYEFSKQLPR